MDQLLCQLNQKQLEAVTSTEGFIRVIAGAGSGKTRALSHRFAFLVNEIGILPGNILCVTFTNKAANEMRHRIHNLIADNDTGYINTFHGFCVSILQEDSHAVQYPKNFLVLDNQDIDSMLKIIYEERGLTLRHKTFSKARDMIEMYKLERYPNYYLDLITMSLDTLRQKYLRATDVNDIIFYGYLYQEKKCFGLDYNDLLKFSLYIFEKNKEMFREFLPKIEYIVVDNSPVNTTTHLRDKFQKNALEKGLADAGENDMILLSDVDEIPNPRVLQELKQNFDPDKVYHLAQRMFYCYINMEEVSGNLLSITGEFPGVERRMWLGTKIFAKRSIPKDGIIQLREAKVTAPNAVRIADGGWHFGYMGSRHEADVSKRIGDKVVAAAHQEYNKQDILAEAKYRLMLGEDMFGRDARFERVEVDDTYPEYLLQHRKDYEYLIMPPISKAKRNYIRISMKVKRFLRKVCRRIRRIFNR